MKKNSTLTENLNAVEPIFDTVDRFKMDFSKCGRFMKEVEQHLNIKLFEYSENHIKCMYGLQKETTKEQLFKGDKTLNIPRPDYFSKGKTLLIYNIFNKTAEFNSVKSVKGNSITLSKQLQNDYPQGSFIVVLRQVEYKFFPMREVLKKRVDNGAFLTVTQRVTGLSIIRFENSKNVFFGIELNGKVQVNGCIFLKELV
jgi:hypothetical protein